MDGRDVMDPHLLTPTTVADGVILAPDDILKMIKCSCGSTTPCKSKRCGCHNANMACTSFCACRGGDGCFNEKTWNGSKQMMDQMMMMMRMMMTDDL